MNKLSIEKRAQVISLLVEGNSMRAITRITGCSINTVTRLLVEAGEACNKYQHEILRNLNCKRIQCDEIWAFCGMKEKNVPEEHQGEHGYGDVYTWTGLDADTKLMVSYMVGKRDAEYASLFINDLASRIKAEFNLLPMDIDLT